jgi:transposase InsO family protein
MINLDLKRQTLIIIQEARDKGCTIKECCDCIEISTRTYIRWNKGLLMDKRKGAKKRVALKLSDSDRQNIIRVCCEDRFIDLTPYCIIATLLDEGIYLGSASTFYRVLREAGLTKHRRKSHPGVAKTKPVELCASGPNQIYSWDITYLKTMVRGIYYFAYVVIDIWSRKIVCWEIHDRESSEIAAVMFKNMVTRLKLQGVTLRSDNGSPMKGGDILSMFYSLGIIPSYSRPRVSNDNPFSESLFKTIKYTAGYPSFFESIDHAMEWFNGFVNWYNTEHKHSGIGYITPEQRHNGTGKLIMDNRNTVMKMAREKHPERWGNKLQTWKSEEYVYLNKAAI